MEREEEDGAVASVEGKDGVAVDAGGDEEF